jgi:hypothetical protein
MTLLKQARAFGVGILLATQNPVDLDYKALSNAGTWFVGKLQTERDKARLVEGLEGVAAEHGTLSNRNYLETVISALGNRVFLLHDVHRGNPLLFQTRWALSFLRGPLTREHVEKLMAPVKAQLAAAAPATAAAPGAAAPVAIPLCRKCHAELPPGAAACPACGEPLAQPVPRLQDQEFKQNLQRAAARPAVTGSAAHVPPVLPPGVTQFYLPVANPVRPAGAAELVYQAYLLGFAEITFADKRRGQEHRRKYHLLARPPAPGQPVAWHAAEKVGESVAAGPEPGARWLDVPESLNTAKKLKALEKAFSDYLYGNTKFPLLENGQLNLYSAPGEDVVAFRQRCRSEAAHRFADELEQEKLKYRPKFQKLGALLPLENPAADRHEGSLLGWINPLKWFGPSGSAARPEPLVCKPGQENNVRRLAEEWLRRQAELREKWKQIGEEYTEVQLTPRRADVQIIQFGLAWAPSWQVTGEGVQGHTVAAYR